MTRHGASRLRKRSPFAALASCALGAFLLASCKSAPDLAPVDPFDLLGAGAALYLTVPVQANQEFVSAAVQRVSGSSASDAKKIAERLDIAYISVGTDGGIQFSAGGNIPTSFVGFALSEKNGWSAGAIDGQTVYTHNQTFFQLCLPSSSNAFLSHDIAPMVRRFNKVAYADFPAEKLPAMRGDSSVSSEKLLSESLGERQFKFLHENISSDIMLYAPSPHDFIRGFLGGVDVNTTVSSIYASLSQYRGVKEQFNVKLILNLSDARTVKATVALLKMAFFGGGVPAKVVQSGQSQITITDLPVTQKQIIAMLR